MSIKALVFDFGNVVGFFSHRRTTERLVPYARMDAAALHQLLYDGPIAHQYERGELSTDAFRATVKQIAQLDCTDAFFDDAYADIFWVNDALCDMLPELARRYPLLLLSNTNELHARKFRVQFAETLAHFRHLILSHEARLRKPQPEIYAHATTLAGCTSAEVLFIDDLPANIEGAREAGWKGVVYTSVEELRQAIG